LDNKRIVLLQVINIVDTGQSGNELALQRYVENVAALLH
jgi:hypothetical protein